ncbi:hypothetical protein QYM36_006999 [Artemia franciscana]|uniref:Uncharacterized protein n=1 Tax=Artemia franciscana TaxID=6661 RepID=A0AA88HVS0_ARTSF|nr:hypothetical protein QYM36_006999 [Artemia franciscana]
MAGTMYPVNRPSAEAHFNCAFETHSLDVTSRPKNSFVLALQIMHNEDEKNLEYLLPAVRGHLPSCAYFFFDCNHLSFESRYEIFYFQFGFKEVLSDIKYNQRQHGLIP